MQSLKEIRDTLQRIKATVFGNTVAFRCEVDNKYDAGRIFIQCVYKDQCRKSGELFIFHGRKWYLSDHMTTDEIVKTCFAAFKTAVEHEIMEGFTVDGVVLFNPHVSFEELLKVSHLEVSRPKKS